MSEDPENALTAAELRRLVAEELSRAGVRVAPRLEADALVLHRSGSETRADIRGTLAQWHSLPEDLRERRIRQIAVLLLQSPLSAQAVPRLTRRPHRMRWFSMLLPIAIAAASAAVTAIAYRRLAPSTQQSATHGAARELEAESDLRRLALGTAACEKTRSRVARDSNIGPADSEGWVVELVLLRRDFASDLSLSRGLSKFITRKPGAPVGTLSWPAAAYLSALQRFDAEVRIGPGPVPGEPLVSGVSLVFSGPYVAAYFAEQQRGDYFKLADALSDELEATDGALFAHCANANSHQIGSWFMGSTPGRAVAALVYFMASYSQVPVLGADLRSVGPGSAELRHPFEAIGAVASDLSRDAAATLIGRESGMISGRPDRPVRLTFPFRDANRATRASVQAAHALRLANAG